MSSFDSLIKPYVCRWPIISLEKCLCHLQHLSLLPPVPIFLSLWCKVCYFKKQGESYGHSFYIFFFLFCLQGPFPFQTWFLTEHFTPPQGIPLPLAAASYSRMAPSPGKASHLETVLVRCERLQPNPTEENKSPGHLLQEWLRHSHNEPKNPFPSFSQFPLQNSLQSACLGWRPE